MAKMGRKQIKDKKEPLTIYVRKSIIKAFGGKAQSRNRLLKMVEEAVDQEPN